MNRLPSPRPSLLPPAETFADVQSVLLRRPPGPAVRHLLLRVPPARALAARRVLQAHCRVSFGAAEAAEATVCSLGFTFAGLEALCLPLGYLRVFQLCSPSFRTGAVRRSVAVGDAGPNSALRWDPAFAEDRAHVVVSWHGRAAAIADASRRLAAEWRTLLPSPDRGTLCAHVKRYRGRRLDGPPGRNGAWSHLGYRDDVTDLAIAEVRRAEPVPDLRRHAPGALLLGWPDDEGLDRFALPQAPDKVRRFFRGASFGVLRKMLHDVAGFDAAVAAWQAQFDEAFGRGPGRSLDPDFARAKLCGRWPDGRALRPGASRPPASATPADYRLELESDAAGDGRLVAQDAGGTGCPFGSHVRRMRAQPDAHGRLVARPLLRRSVPFGPPVAGGGTTSRGQWGHFFCADIENQFEHLLGQWAARPLLAAAAADTALDPFVGVHDDPGAGLVVPLEGRMPQRLTGLGPWTRARGTTYAWHPAEDGLRMLLEGDFVPKEAAGPWL